MKRFIRRGIHTEFVWGRTKTLLISLCLWILALAGLATVTPTACLATDGTAGTSSTGTVSPITLTIDTLVRISDLNDLTLNFTGVGNLNSDDALCVWTNDSAGTYHVTVSGNGASEAFTVALSGQTIPFTVWWNDAANTTGNHQLTTKVQAGPYSNANTSSQTCAGPGDNADIQVKVAASDMLKVHPGKYSGTLTIVIAP